MAGTDTSLTSTLGGPAIILVAPQLGQNIGTTARAMLNCGLTDLRLVAPRDGWPNPNAIAAASGADAVLDSARVFDDVESAVADLQHLYATTARPRDMNKPVLTPRETAAELRTHHDAGERCGLLFGPERAGLINDHIVLADAVVAVPLNPAFRSLNLAQAVLLLGYEWYQTGDPQLPSTPGKASAVREHNESPANKEELYALFEHLESELEAANYFYPAEKRPIMQRTLRNLLQRAGLTDSEVRTLRGVVGALGGARLKDRDSQEASDST